MTAPIDLRPDHLEIVQSILANHLPAGVSVRVFGSRAKWTAKPYSDLDLALKGPKKLPRSLVSDLTEAFSESDLPFKVDVLDWHDVAPSFQAVVDRDGVLMAAKNRWQTEPLEDCLEVLIDYRGKSPPKSVTGIPVLSAKVVKTTGLLRPIEQTIAPDYYPKWMTRGLPHPGDVVMTTEAPMGEVIQLDEETSKFALGQRIVCMRGKAGNLDNTFLRYLLTSPTQQDVLASYATGTTVLGISQKALRSVPISFPSYDEQKQIGGLLAALDDKIELNRRMNATLEAQARALFRDWFVDFGPTRAKQAGSPAYLAPDLWSLFPSALDAEGKPEGWSDGTFGDIAKAVNQKADPNGIDPETPYIGLEHMPRRSIALSEWEGAGKVSSGKSRFKAGQILFGKLRPYFHKVGVAPVSGICSTDIVVIEAKRPELSAVALVCASTDEFVVFSDQSSTGTKMPRTSWQILAKFPLVKAGGAVNPAFQAMVAPMVESIQHHILQSRTLAKTRDLLLPKLMSGEISVRAAEREVSAAL